MLIPLVIRKNFYLKLKYEEHVMIGTIRMQGHANFIHRSLAVASNPKAAVVILSAILVSGCGTNRPIQKTGNVNEPDDQRDRSRSQVTFAHSDCILMYSMCSSCSLTQKRLPILHILH